jgi:ADP-ribose pyrophosphatase YjhB (NUDIX family)
LEFIVKNTKPKFNTPEWGFPKGRRNYHEKNVDCAHREFYEETSYTNEEYNLLNNVTPINEIFNGTNGILYKHIYYLGVDTSDKEATINQNNIHQIDEIVFFLVTTTISLDKGISLILPAEGNELEVNKKNIVNILINDRGKVLMDDEPTKIDNIKSVAQKKISSNSKIIFIS